MDNAEPNLLVNCPSPLIQGEYFYSREIMRPCSTFHKQFPVSSFSLILWVNLERLMLLPGMSNTENSVPRVQCIKRRPISYFQASRWGDQEGDEPSDHEAEKATSPKVWGLPWPRRRTSKETTLGLWRGFALWPAGCLHQAGTIGGGQLCHCLQRVQQPHKAGDQ